MKIPFEKWIEDNSIPEEAKELFAESIICYKISAYRSAFIMSYSPYLDFTSNQCHNSPMIIKRLKSSVLNF